MQTFSILGFVFGISALSMVVLAKEQIEKLKIDIVELKEELNKIKIKTDTQEK